jgi:hypothetical protein
VDGENSVFGKNDRKNAYQAWIRSSVGAMGSGDAGMTLSFSGALQRNLWSFGRSGSYGYSTAWNGDNATAAHGTRRTTPSRPGTSCSGASTADSCTTARGSTTR